MSKVINNVLSQINKINSSVLKEGTVINNIAVQMPESPPINLYDEMLAEVLKLGSLRAVINNFYIHNVRVLDNNVERLAALLGVSGSGIYKRINGGWNHEKVGGGVGSGDNGNGSKPKFCS